MKIICISKLIRKMCRIIIRYPLVYHPPLTYRTLNRPPPAAVSIILGTGIDCPDKNFCTRKLLRMGQRLRIRYPYPHPTPLTHRTRDFPPPDRLSGNHPELVKLPVDF